MNDDYKQAINMLLGKDAWDFAGPHNAKNRQVILSGLCGKKIPTAKCGVTAIREKLFELSGANGKGSCLADRERLAMNWVTCEYYRLKAMVN